MMGPLVSVKMITYNHAPYIAQAIEGVINQRVNFPIELVIGEDCSTDGTREIVFEYQKKYPDIIRVITSEENVGMKKNGYRTTKACHGKYLAFCEGDDYWHNEKKLELQVIFLEKNPKIGMVSGDVDIYYEKKNIFKRNFNKNNGFRNPMDLNIDQILWGGLPIWTCTVMIRKDLHERIIESDSYLHKNDKLLLGDLQVWAEASEILKATYIPETLATYRVLEESASRSKDPKKNLRFMKSISEIKLYLCQKYQVPEKFRKKEELSWCDNSLRLAFRERNYNLASEVRKRKNKFNCKELFRYYGAKYSLIHYSYRALSLVTGFFRQKGNDWP